MLKASLSHLKASTLWKGTKNSHGQLFELKRKINRQNVESKKKNYRNNV